MIAVRPTSADGTVVHAWHTAPGTQVLLCDGLGSSAAAWPTLVRPDSGLAVVGWHYRGLGGSPKPTDRRRITVEDHVADAVAAMDASGVARAVVVSWSIGVNVAFELALRHPDRVAGVLAVAGVPGGTFGAMLGGAPLPARARHAAALTTAQAMRAAGPVLTAAARRIRPTPRLVQALVRVHVVDRAVDVDAMQQTLDGFRRHDLRWYFTLALALAQHAPMDLGEVRCPVVFVAGTDDQIAAEADVARAAERVRDAEVVTLRGTHYLPLEHPDAMRRLLDGLISRCAG